VTPREAFDALYYECIPIRITRPAPNACVDGPTEQWRLIEAQRELWALAALAGTDEPLLTADSQAGVA
jgi:hypothetical protein